VVQSAALDLGHLFAGSLRVGLGLESRSDRSDSGHHEVRRRVRGPGSLHLVRLGDYFRYGWQGSEDPVQCPAVGPATGLVAVLEAQCLLVEESILENRKRRDSCQSRPGLAESQCRALARCGTS